MAALPILRNFFAAFIFALNVPMQAQPQWQYFHSGSAASLRGLSAVSVSICWTSGSEGTVLLTQDGGRSWSDISPKGYSELQFRDVEAFNDSTAVILSAGFPAVILRTTDAGRHWKEVYRNEKEGIFFDAMDFWDNKDGFAFSDAPQEKPVVLVTNDTGLSWQGIDPEKLPTVGEGQGGFAASGTCLATFGEEKVIIGLGGPEASVLLSEDAGENWIKTSAPLDAGEASKGIFSFDFIDAENGFCVGGDYRADSLTTNNIARTTDGGHSWQLVKDPGVSGKYRSCIAYVNADTLLAVSRTGCSFSNDGGINWNACNGLFFSLSVVQGAVWASGPEGRVARWKF